MPRIDAFEATFKAALKLSLDQWAQRQAGTLGDEPAVHARPSHRSAARTRSRRCEDRCRQANSNAWHRRLSLVFGVEVLIVLKDIWGLDSRKMMSVAQWAAGALVRAAVMKSMTEGHRSAPATATE